MTDDQLQDKFVRLARPVLGDRVEDVVDMLWRLEKHSMHDVHAALEQD